MEVLRTFAGRLTGVVRGAGAASIAIGVLGLAGALLLLLTEFSTIAEVDVLTTGTCREIADADAREACRTTGLEQHGGAFLLLGGLALAMTVGVARRASRPAAVALIVIGVVVLALSLLRDLPKTQQEGLVGQSYNDAKAGPGPGFYFELAGGGLLVLAGGSALARRPTAPRAPEPRPRRSPRARAEDQANGEAG